MGDPVRTVIIAALMVISVMALWLYNSHSSSRTEAVVLTAKQEAQRWSAQQQSRSSGKRSSPMLMASAECRAFNEQVVKAMHVLYQEGYSPPFGPDPLLEIVRSGKCSEDNPSVQVLLGWIAETKKQSAVTPRSNGR